MGTVLSNFHGEAHGETLRRILWSRDDRTDRYSITYKEMRRGKDIGQPFAHSRVVALEPERRVVSRCIVTWLLFFLFLSCLQDESLRDNSTSTRMYRKNADASKNLCCLGIVKLLRVCELLAFLQSRNRPLATFIDSYPICALLKNMPRWKIPRIRTSSSCLRRFFFSSPLVSLRCFRTCRQRTGKRREEEISKR